MKKIFLTSFLYFVSLGFVFAQIGELTPVEQHLDIKRVLKNVWMVYDKSDNTYCLKIDSDNEYEDQYALLLLGKGENEALQSLINLYKALQQPDNIFNVQEYKIFTFAVKNSKYAGISTNSGPLEHAAGSYTFEEEGLGYAMVMIIDKIEDFDFSSSIVTTTKIWGGAKSPIGITGIMCDIYLPSIDVHFVGGIDVKNYANSKTFTKLVEPLAKEGLVWGTTEYDIVLNGINNGIISTDRSFLDKICRLKTSK